jgi:MoaA/NifB/PqqE/SkfB family radical SAM enzyme
MSKIKSAAIYLKNAYNIARDEGLHSMFKEMHRSYIQRFRPARTTFSPTAVELEVSSHCNLDCIMCRKGFNIGGKHEKLHMSLERFETLLKRMPFLKLISFRGCGEPILNPEIVEIVSLAKRRGKKLILFTNGMKMDAEMARALMSVHIDEIVFSIDAARQETFAGIRRGGDLERIFRNIEAVGDEIRAERNGTRLSSMFLMMRQNWREFPELVERLDGTGVSVLVAKQFNPGLSEELQADVMQRSQIEEFHETLHGLSPRDMQLISSEEMCQAISFSDFLCMKIWECPFITVKGDLSMCPMTYYNVDVKYGNVFEQDFDKVWNNPLVKDHRKKLNCGELKVCQECPGMKMRAEVVKSLKQA